jgi:hypothetical protein
MTLKHAMSTGASSHQVDYRSEQEKNEKYKLLTKMIEKKILNLQKENKTISSRYK